MPGLGLLLATWTTNANNLYSSSLILAAIAGIANNFISFLLMLGVVMPPIAAIYVSDYFVLRRGTYEASLLTSNAAVNWKAFFAWAAASSVGFAGTYGELTLSSIPAVDSMVLASLIYAGLTRLRAKK